MVRLVSYMEDMGTDVSEYDEAFSDTMKNVMSKMGDATSKVVDLDKLMNRVKDMLGGLSAVSDVIKTLSSLGDAANRINDTFDSLAGGLDASLVSALSSAIGPSMSLSTSMGEYDVSLTEKPSACLKSRTAHTIFLSRKNDYSGKFIIFATLKHVYHEFKRF